MLIPCPAAWCVGDQRADDGRAISGQDGLRRGKPIKVGKDLSFNVQDLQGGLVTSQPLWPFLNQGEGNILAEPIGLFLVNFP
jgi:hypothetical protein